MILIAHRGNTTRPQPELENTMPYLLAAIAQGYHVELDVWAFAGDFYLGHDSPITPVSLSDLRYIGDAGWFHAKNIEALQLLKSQQFNTFFHDQDQMTLTSTGIIWSHNGINNPGGIVCMPNLSTEPHLLQNALGVCHDCLGTVKELIRVQDWRLPE